MWPLLPKFLCFPQLLVQVQCVSCPWIAGGWQKFAQYPNFFRWRRHSVFPTLYTMTEKVHLICQSTHICTKIVIQMLLVNVIQVFLHKITFVSGYGNSIIHVKVNGFKEIQYQILRQLVVSLIRRQRHYFCLLTQETQGRLKEEGSAHYFRFAIVNKL